MFKKQTLYFCPGKPAIQLRFTEKLTGTESHFFTEKIRHVEEVNGKNIS